MKRFRRFLLRWLLRAVMAVLLLTVVLTLPLRWLDPPTSMFMLLERWQTGQWPQYHWVPAEQLPDGLRLAVIAAEDQNFPHHRGFDAAQIRAALEGHRQGGSLRGASTLSQQLARNLYLWPQRSWLRKGLEAWFTVPLELFLPKDRLLLIYLNVAEFGPGVYGAEAAAQHHFGKPASSLSRQESALLAASLPAPKRRDPANPDQAMLERQRWILRQMDNLGTGWLP